MKNIYRIILVMVLTLATFFVVPSSDGQTWKQWDRARINSMRATHHEAPLRYNYGLQQEAQLWAQRMATRGHATQNYNTRACWAIQTSRVFGDNAGVAPTVPEAQQFLERSPSHRANMLDRDYRWLGIGIAWGWAAGYRWVYIDQIYCG